MKQSLLIGFLVIVCINTIGQKKRMGIKAGLNYSSIIGEFNGWGNYNRARTSYHFGLLSEMSLSDKITFQPELLYSSIGKRTVEESIETSTLKLNYLTIPLNAKIKIFKNFSALAGPQLGFLLSAKFLEYRDNETFPTLNVKHDFSNIEVGVNVGFEYKISNDIFVDTRYNMGLSNMLNPDLEDNYKRHNRVLQFSVGYLF